MTTPRRIQYASTNAGQYTPTLKPYVPDVPGFASPAGIEDREFWPDMADAKRLTAEYMTAVDTLRALAAREPGAVEADAQTHADAVAAGEPEDPGTPQLDALVAEFNAAQRRVSALALAVCNLAESARAAVMGSPGDVWLAELDAARESCARRINRKLDEVAALLAEVNSVDAAAAWIADSRREDRPRPGLAGSLRGGQVAVNLGSTRWQFEQVLAALAAAVDVERASPVA
jgi:hypothetical protein